MAHASMPTKIREHQRQTLAKGGVDGGTPAIGSMEEHGRGATSRRGGRVHARRGARHQQSPPLRAHEQIPCVCGSHGTAMPGHSAAVKLSPYIPQCSCSSRMPCGADMDPGMGANVWRAGVTAAVARPSAVTRECSRSLHQSTSHAKLNPSLRLHHMLSALKELADRWRLGTVLGRGLSGGSVTKIVDRCQNAVTTASAECRASPCDPATWCI
jgi:hypothetical protein